MRFPYKIVKNINLPRIERKLELEHFLTFDNGHKLYTYKIEDLAQISGRYSDNVKTILNFMIQYNASPEHVKKFGEKIGNLATEGVKAMSPKEKDAILMKIHHFASEIPKLQDYVKDIELSMWHSLYTMFFVLDVENEMLFSPKHNAQKIKYLETLSQEDQERIFFFLKTLMIRFSDTYKSDTLNSIIKEAKMIDLVESLISPMKRQNLESRLQNMQV